MFISVLHDTDDNISSIRFRAVYFTPILIEEVGINHHSVVTELVKEFSPFLDTVFVGPQADVTFHVKEWL
jgi:hypothetical protein